MKELTNEQVEKLLYKQKNYFQTQETKDLAFRLGQLKTLKAGIKKHEAAICQALFLDLGKSENEAYMTEIGLIYESINLAMKKLHKWMKPKKVSTPIGAFPSRSFILSEPYGTVLIISPYNYPFQLTIEPLIGAIIAGNTAVVKPSELSIHTSDALKAMFEEVFKEQYIYCAEGGVPTNTALMNAPFDYIFFTGSVPVGKIVMAAAVKNLVPVTLELGGKSPVMVDETADIAQAAKRIIWGKTLNTGQTCIAPDYLFVHEKVRESLITEMKSALLEFFGENIEESSSFGRMINDRHFDRVANLIEKDKKGLVFGGKTNPATRYIEPTLIEVSSFEAATMQEEIFGPVLPILTYSDSNEVFAAIQAHPKPLAFYLFTQDKALENRALQEISSGNACINDTISHVINPNLPFGGVGNSGMGSYHGEQNFLTFSHQKGVLKKAAKWGVPLIFPPYSKKQLNLVKKLYK
ncbi:MAG: aldehyde dehydrogenase [Lactobacillales bacterium]|jgi:aldehyde dehydrogenase (NAD+)|nr:aldehyde dehydrogenase [Lactobacillales bacterium]